MHVDRSTPVPENGHRNKLRETVHALQANEPDSVPARKNKKGHAFA